MRLGSIVLALMAAGGLHAEPTFVAGTAPSVRPAGAPAIQSDQRTEAGRKALLHGVEQPYPKSVVDVVETQGNWYTPFDRPGMTGPYDIRMFHRVRATAR